MYHFFVEPHQIGAEEIRIEGADVNHIRNVLRMKPGEKILISSREGGDYFCNRCICQTESSLYRRYAEGKANFGKDSGRTGKQ